VHPKDKPNPPASEKAILELASSLPRPLPPAYLKAMAIANGGTGFIGDRFVRLCFVGKLLGRNTKCQVAESAPDLFLIGSDGGGEAYASDLAKADGAVYQVPFIGLDPKEAWVVADSFDVFLPRTNLYQH
jgi:hypothetical protein